MRKSGPCRGVRVADEATGADRSPGTAGIGGTGFAAEADMGTEASIASARTTGERLGNERS